MRQHQRNTCIVCGGPCDKVAVDNSGNRYLGCRRCVFSTNPPLAAEAVDLEKLVAAFVANAITCYNSATVAAVLVRGAAHMAHVKGATREQFTEAAGRAFDATGDRCPKHEERVP